MMSAKNETHSLFATLWFTIAHYCLRPWPWILVALGALVLMPRLSDDQINNQNVIEEYREAFLIYKEYKINGTPYNNIADADLHEKIDEFQNENFYESYENTVDPGKMYPKLMVKYLPTGLLGLLLAVFLAAYMSTIASQLNWGTSYLINDFYRRFLKKNGSEKHYVLISRLMIILMMITSLFITKYVLTTISGAWEFIINASAGLGAVLILRWFWWRINAWSEISAMIAPLIIYPVAKYGFGLESPITLYPIVIGTTIVWLAVTFLTKSTDENVISDFYRKVHPGGIGWRKFKLKYPDVVQDTGYMKLFINWFAGVVLIYSTLYASGRIIFGDYLIGFIGLAVGIASAVVIYINIKNENLIND
jgi:Na+(H+)/acetate symporter ActP